MIPPNDIIAALLFLTAIVMAPTAARSLDAGEPELAATAALVFVVSSFAAYEFLEPRGAGGEGG